MNDERKVLQARPENNGEPIFNFVCDPSICANSQVLDLLAYVFLKDLACDEAVLGVLVPFYFIDMEDVADRVDGDCAV